VISALRATWAVRHHHVGVYADNVDVVATGTAGEFDTALSVTQQQYTCPELRGRDGLVPSRRRPSTAPRSRRSCRTGSQLRAGRSRADRTTARSAARTAHVDTSVLKPEASSSNSCLALTGLPDACNLPSNFASNYGLDKLYTKGADGSGQTLAIVTLAALDPGAPQYYWSNIATSRPPAAR
jgi:kumamolisin